MDTDRGLGQGVYGHSGWGMTSGHPCRVRSDDPAFFTPPPGEPCGYQMPTSDDRTMMRIRRWSIGHGFVLQKIILALVIIAAAIGGSRAGWTGAVVWTVLTFVLCFILISVAAVTIDAFRILHARHEMRRWAQGQRRWRR